MTKAPLKVTHGSLDDVVNVKAVNATVRYDGKNDKGSDTYDILLDCSAILALERLEVCTDHRHDLNYASKNSGLFSTQGRGLLAFEYEGIPNGLLIITARCDEFGKSEGEIQEYLQQAIDKAREHADKHVKKHP